jgi:uncharacterized membrane protein
MLNNISQNAASDNTDNTNEMFVAKLGGFVKAKTGGQLSPEEFAKRKAAYEKLTGRKLEQPKTFKPSEKARQATLDKYNQLPVVQAQPSETTQQSRGVNNANIQQELDNSTREEIEERVKSKKENSDFENYEKIKIIKKTLAESQEKIVDLLIDAKGELIQKQLQHRSGLPKATLSRNIDVLLKKGIIIKPLIIEIQIT